VRVTPRAGRDEAGRFENGVLAIKLRATPVDGAANASLIEFLARELGVAKTCVTIVRGQRSRQKLIEIEGLEYDQVIARLGQQS
jgi:hypothetical protein